MHVDEIFACNSVVEPTWCNPRCFLSLFVLRKRLPVLLTLSVEMEISDNQCIIATGPRRACNLTTAPVSGTPPISVFISQHKLVSGCRFRSSASLHANNFIWKKYGLFIQPVRGMYLGLHLTAFVKVRRPSELSTSRRPRD